METITIPDDLAARLRARAAANRRSLDAEALAVLDRGLPPAAWPDVVLIVREDRDSDHGREPLADRIRAFRERLPVRMEVGEAEQAIRADRGRA